MSPHPPPTRTWAWPIGVKDRRTGRSSTSALHSYWIPRTIKPHAASTLLAAQNSDGAKARPTGGSCLEAALGGPQGGPAPVIECARRPIQEGVQKMSGAQVCKSCGIPRRTSRSLTWSSNGTITEARNPDHRMVFADVDGLGELFANIEGLIGISIQSIIT